MEVCMARIGILLLAALAVAGCQFPVDYEGRDKGVFFPAFRASFQAQPTRKAAGDHPPESGTLFIDVDISGGRGSSSQRLSAGEFISIDGTDFNGPTTVTGDWKLTLGSVSSRSGWEFGMGRIQGFAGLGVSHLEIELSDPGARESDTATSLGPYFGVRGEFDPLKRLSIYGQVGLMFGWGSGAMASMSAAEAGLRFKPIDQLGIFAGYRQWGYRREGFSAIDLEMQGPVLGVELDF
jgi:hypothetical protein